MELAREEDQVAPLIDITDMVEMVGFLFDPWELRPKVWQKQIGNQTMSRN